jgi:hypothetical protein
MAGRIAGRIAGLTLGDLVGVARMAFLTAVRWLMRDFFLTDIMISFSVSFFNSVISYAYLHSKAYANPTPLPGKVKRPFFSCV